MPPIVHDLFRTAPSCSEIRAAGESQDAELSALHPGEREVIILAEEIKADLVIPDDREARSLAETRGLKVCGLLKILELGDIHRQISLPRAVEKLRRTNFKVSDRLIQKMLLRHIERQISRIRRIE
jgi:predicted nucleic acid-binding protein